MKRRLIVGFFLLAIGCGSSTSSQPVSTSSPPPPPLPSDASSPSTTAANAPKPCSIAMVNIRVKDVSSDGGVYEAVGTIDLSQPIPNEPFSLNERIRRRACDQGGDAVGILNTESGTGTEYVVLRKRHASPASSGSSRPSIEYFPSSSSTANRPADMR